MPLALTIPALTPMVLEIGEALSSRTCKPGDFFPLRLAVPIVVDGVTLVASGATGQGEVIEAKHGGMSGSSGVLILAARYLTVDGRQLRLRSMHFAEVGADRRVLAIAVGAAPFVGPLGFFISGGETEIAAGTFAQAKTAQPFVLDGPAPVSPSPADAPPAVESAPPAPASAPPVSATKSITMERKTK